MSREVHRALSVSASAAFLIQRHFFCSLTCLKQGLAQSRSHKPSWKMKMVRVEMGGKEHMTSDVTLDQSPKL